jgi:hypothetical protein
MGCAGSRGNLSDEEWHITRSENSVGFGPKSSETIDLVVRKHANGSDFNKLHMRAILKKLGLKFPHEKHEHHHKDGAKHEHKHDEHHEHHEHHEHLKQFYQSFEVSDGYSFRDFLLAGILLGHGTPKSKAQLIWDVFDVNGDKKLARANYVELFRTLADISLDKTTAATHLDVDHQKKVSAYLDKLRGVKAKFLTEIVSDSAKTEELVPKKVFVQYASEHQAHHFLTPTGIRKAIEAHLPKADNAKHLSKEAPVHTNPVAISQATAHPTANSAHAGDHKEPAH